MQLTLLTPLAQRPAVAARPTPAHTTKATREAAALSQLDRIAAANLRSPVQGLGTAAAVLALVGGLLVLGSASLWQAPRQERSVPAVAAPPQAAPGRAAAQAPVAVVPAVVVATAPEPLPNPAHAAPAVEPAPDAVLAAVAAVSTAAVVADAQPTSTRPQDAAVTPAAALPDEAAARARARLAAEARRKAQLAAQERLAAAAEAQRLQLLQQQQQQQQQQLQQQRDAELARERAQHLAAAESARAKAALPVVAAPRKTVSELCLASSGFISETFCQTRECRKSEYRGDAVCVRLRELQDARQQLAADR